MVLKAEEVMSVLRAFHMRSAASSEKDAEYATHRTRHTFDALTRLGHFLLRLCDASVHRVRGGGRELLPLVMAHQEA